MAYIGYHDERDLPFTRGQRVRIPAGTTIKSNGKESVTKRDRFVTIRIVYPGQSICIGHVDSQGHRHGQLYWKHDARTLQERFGNGNVDELVHHPDTIVRPYRNIGSIFLPLANPSVSWWGSHGECEVDINLVDTKGT